MKLSAYAELAQRRFSAATQHRAEKALPASKARSQKPKACEDYPDDDDISTCDQTVVAKIVRRERAEAHVNVAALSPTEQARKFAASIEAAAAAAEGREPQPLFKGPDQTSKQVTGDDMVRALRKMGLTAKPGEGL